MKFRTVFSGTMICTSSTLHSSRICSTWGKSRKHPKWQEEEATATLAGNTTKRARYICTQDVLRPQLQNFDPTAITMSTHAQHLSILSLITRPLVPANDNRPKEWAAVSRVTSPCYRLNLLLGIVLTKESPLRANIGYLRHQKPKDSENKT